MNPYEVLGVREDATLEEVAHAFRELARRYHPDIATDESDRRLRRERFVQISQAYNQIKSQLTGQKNAQNESDESDDKDRLKWIMERASAFFASNNLDAVIALLKPLKDKLSEKGWMLLGESYLKKKRFHEALRCFKKASDMNQWNIEAMIGIAHVYEKVGLISSAIKVYEDILKLDSTNSIALKKLSALKGKQKFSLGTLFKKVEV